MKTICIYHSRDLDGWMSAAIVKKSFLEQYTDGFVRNFNESIPENLDELPYIIMLGWDHGDEVPDLSGYDKIIMIDIAFSAETMFKLHVNTIGRLIWIDHHESAINDLNNFYKEELDRKNLYGYPIGVRDVKFAACELTWHYYFPYVKMPEIVRLLGRYDCFSHKGTDEEQQVLEFQYGARAHMNNYEDCYKYLTVLTTEAEFDMLVNDGEAIYCYLCTEARQTYAKAFPIKFNNTWLINAKIKGRRTPPLHKEYKFLCVNQERFNPINFGLNYHDEGYDGFACFWYKKGKWSWSLYNDDGRVDVSVVAKQFSGGGHKGAAGMVIDTNSMLKIIS